MEVLRAHLDGGAFEGSNLLDRAARHGATRSGLTHCASGHRDAGHRQDCRQWGKSMKTGSHTFLSFVTLRDPCRTCATHPLRESAGHEMAVLAPVKYPEAACLPLHSRRP